MSRTDTLCLFKSSRRQEYIEENLRILSGVHGDEVRVGYTARWLAHDIKADPPRIGERALVVFSDRPYETSVPIRFARIAGVDASDAILRLDLDLEERAAVDRDAWNKALAGGPDPKGGQFVMRVGFDGTVVRPIVDEQEEHRAWMSQIDAVSQAEEYADVAFLGIERVREPDGVRLAPPFLLAAGKRYEVTIRAHNPHLAQGDLRKLRLFPRPDSTRVALAMDDLAIPPDGTLSFTLQPLTGDPVALEFNIARGTEFCLALQMDWRAAVSTAPVSLLPTDPSELEPQIVVGDEAAQVPSKSSGREARSEALMRAYRIVAGEPTCTPPMCLQLLDQLIIAAPDAERLIEERGVILGRLGRHAEAVEVLDDLAPSRLGAVARTALVVGWFELGRLPEPIDQIKIGEFSDDDHLEALLRSSVKLSSGDQVRLAQFLADGVLADHRASTWIDKLIRRDGLARRERIQLLETWTYTDAISAAASAEHQLDDGRLDIADPETAQTVFVSAVEAQRAGLVHTAARALAAQHASRGDVAALMDLLQVVTDRFEPDSRRGLAIDIVKEVAVAADGDTPIDPAVGVVCEVLDELCSRGELAAAADVADLGAANLHRVTDETRSRFEQLQSQLESLLERSQSMHRYREAQARELDEHLRSMGTGRHVVVVGSQEPEWWSSTRAEIGLDSKSVWVPSEKSKPPKPSHVKKLQRNADLLIVHPNIGHSLEGALKDEAERHGTEVVYLQQTGRDAFRRTLADALEPRGPSDEPSNGGETP